MACCAAQCPKCGSHMVGWYGTPLCVWCDVVYEPVPDDRDDDGEEARP